MSNILQNSTSVGFRDTGGKRLVLETDNDASLVKATGTSHVKLYPTSAGATVTPVLGGCVRTATGIPEDVVDYVSFSGSSSSSLQYYPSGAVSILDSRFFKSSPAIAYDEPSNSLVLDKNEAYGIVKISYRTYFDRYVVTHGDAPCRAATLQTLNAGDDTVKKATPDYDPAFLVATASGWETASMEVSGPPCSQNDDSSRTKQYSDYDPVGIKIEVDPLLPPGLYPEYFTADNVPMGFTLLPQTVVIGGQEIKLFCGCRVRIYPKTAVTLYGVNCAVGSQIIGSGSKPVLQSLTFSGSQATNLDYPPSGVVSLSGTGANALSLFNDNVSVDFVGPGGWVNEVLWVTRNQYELIKGARKVRDDEVVVVTAAGNNTIPCYTFAQAQYTSDYYVYDVVFNWDDRIGWYAPAMVLARASDGRIGHLQITPPSKGGVL